MKIQDFRQKIKEVTGTQCVERIFENETEKLFDTVFQAIQSKQKIFSQNPFVEKEKRLYITITLNPFSDSVETASDQNKNIKDKSYQYYNLYITYSTIHYIGFEYEICDNYYSSSCDNTGITFKNEIFLLEETYVDEEKPLDCTFQKYQRSWLENYLPLIFKELGFKCKLIVDEDAKSGVYNVCFSAQISFKDLIMHFISNT